MDTLGELVTLATFAALWPLLWVGHLVADHVTGQTDWQAAHKAAPRSRRSQRVRIRTAAGARCGRVECPLGAHLPQRGRS